MDYFREKLLFVFCNKYSIVYLIDVWDCFKEELVWIDNVKF